MAAYYHHVGYGCSPWYATQPGTEAHTIWAQSGTCGYIGPGCTAEVLEVLLEARAYLQELRVVTDAVEFTLSVTPTGTARPSEVANLLGISDASINHLCLRTRIHWRDRETC